jgi:hypothetical protein
VPRNLDVDHLVKQQRECPPKQHVLYYEDLLLLAEALSVEATIATQAYFVFGETPFEVLGVEISKPFLQDS